MNTTLKLSAVLFLALEPDGKGRKGKCRLEKGDDQWVYTAEWEEDGKKMTAKNITRKIKK